jgi:DNA polymerase delta subunit 2
VLSHSPSVYAVGNQPSFESELMRGPLGEMTRVVLVPKFSETGQVVIVNTTSLAVQTIRFHATQGWA